jgi:hypothetical protein
MGMFDYLNFKGHDYQSKDTPNQWMANYEIREDGTLWVEESDGEWIKDENSLLGGYIKESNHRWVQVENYTGEIRFYRHLDKEYKVWEEFSAYFVQGQLKHLVPIDPPSD